MTTPPFARPAPARLRARWPRVFASPGPDSADAGSGWDGRWMALLVALVGTTLLLLALSQFAAPAVWAWFGVPFMGAPFADLHVFPAAHQTLAAGGEIYTPMSVETWNRSFNYPPLWLTFMHFSMAQIPWVGGAMIGAWAGVLLLVCGRLSISHGLLVGFLMCSPATVLALERGNTDLIIFALCGLSLCALRREVVAVAWGSLLVATTLKLFPVFAFGSLLRLGWKRAWPWLAAGAAGTLALCAIQFTEIIGVLRETPKGGILSYGSTVWIHVANQLYAQKTGVLEAFSAYLRPAMLAGFLLVGTAFLAGYRQPRRDEAPVSPSLDAFRAGAGIFVATFLLGGHFVYRLIFLLLCVPWLLGRDPSTRRARRMALVVLTLVMWLNPLWDLNLYFARECAVWTLASVLAWLLGRTLPTLTWPKFVTRLRPHAINED